MCNSTTAYLLRALRQSLRVVNSEMHWFETMGHLIEVKCFSPSSHALMDKET